MKGKLFMKLQVEDVVVLKKCNFMDGTTFRERLTETRRSLWLHGRRNQERRGGGRGSQFRTQPGRSEANSPLHLCDIHLPLVTMLHFHPSPDEPHPRTRNLENGRRQAHSVFLLPAAVHQTNDVHTDRWGPEEGGGKVTDRMHPGHLSLLHQVS